MEACCEPVHKFRLGIANMIPNHILNDLCARFIINLPEKESQDVIRVFFQVELAHWFYLDFYWSENLCKACSLKEFAYEIFNYCPSLTKFKENFDQAFESWKIYKQSVPTYGAIMLDPGLEFCLLLQGYWVKSSWGFPKGKVNQDEAPIDCAIREVLEETGFNITDMVDPNNYLEYHFNEQVCRLYVVPGVSMDTKFQAQTRQEIKDYTWFRVNYLPSHKKDTICKVHYNMNANAFFMVIPFLRELKVKIQQMKTSTKGHPQQQQQHAPHKVHHGDTLQEQPIEEKIAKRSRKNTDNISKQYKEKSKEVILNQQDLSPNIDNGLQEVMGFPAFEFVSSEWLNFKLNTEEVLDAMCSSLNS